MSKFLLNLLVQIFKALPNSKIQFKIQKEILPLFQPEQPNWPNPPFWPSPPRQLGHLHSSWVSASWSAQTTPSPHLLLYQAGRHHHLTPERRHVATLVCLPVCPFSSPKQTPPLPLPLPFPHNCPPSSWPKQTPSLAFFKAHHLPPSPHLPEPSPHL
jgi:hypothetical protein